MSENRGKKFEEAIRKSFEKVDGVSIDRLHDQTNGFKGSQNICDFIVYKKPYEYYIECKSIRGASLPFSNITDTQWTGLLEKSKIEGVFAGVICWWTDKDITLYIPIQILEQMKQEDRKSYNYNALFTLQSCKSFVLNGRKKRVFFEYDMTQFFNELEKIHKKSRRRKW